MDQVRDYMSSPVVSVLQGATLAEVESVLADSSISGALVVGEAGLPVGMISRTDLLHAGIQKLGPGWHASPLHFPTAATARSVMTPELTSIQQEQSLSDAARLMRSHHVHRLVVRDGSEIVGIFSHAEVLRVVAERRVLSPLKLYASKCIARVDPDEALGRAVQRLHDDELHHLVVMRSEIPFGVFGLTEALRAKDAPSDSTVRRWLNPTLICMPDDTPLYRAAARALVMGAELMVCMRDDHPHGVVSGSDLLDALL